MRKHRNRYLKTWYLFGFIPLFVIVNESISEMDL